MNRKVEAHAIVRYDSYLSDVADAISVVAVVPTRDEAEAEVNRLAEPNAEKRSRYFWTPRATSPTVAGVSTS